MQQLLYNNLRNLLHVSGTYCGHLQGGAVRRNITENVKTVYKYKMFNFK
jgi:hypothetical protein